jgi:hypothetical protein
MNGLDVISSQRCRRTYTSFVFIGTIIGITSAVAVMLSHWPLKIVKVCFMCSIYRYMEQTTIFCFEQIRWGTETSAATRKLLLI